MLVSVLSYRDVTTAPPPSELPQVAVSTGSRPVSTASRPAARIVPGEPIAPGDRQTSRRQVEMISTRRITTTAAVIVSLAAAGAPTATARPIDDQAIGATPAPASVYSRPDKSVIPVTASPGQSTSTEASVQQAVVRIQMPPSGTPRRPPAAGPRAGRTEHPGRSGREIPDAEGALVVQPCVAGARQALCLGAGVDRRSSAPPASAPRRTSGGELCRA